MLTSDTYKYSHWKQYPPGTEYVYSYMESRGGEFGDDMVVAGIQVVLEDIAYLASVHEPLVMRKAFFAKHFGSDKIYNEKGFERLWEKYHGRLPVVIKALPEGTVVRKHNVFLTIENTDPEFPWLTNYLETLLMHAWYTCTVATKSRDMKKLLLHYLKKSGDESLIDFKLHDFGFRGASSDVTAGRGGLAHLISFKGTDTEIALTTADWHYNEEMAGFSIPAAEHSTITSWGRENEAKAYENMLDQFPDTMVAVVSDSYDIYNACKNIWGGVLKEKVFARKFPVVIRPDSGTPEIVLVKCLEILGEAFGYTVNSKGYKVLHPNVRLIQGDGISGVEATRSILEAITLNGWSVDNVAFGMGGGLLQLVNRDTMKMALKASWISGVTDGQRWERSFSKDPVTDPGKQSKAGRFKVIETRTQEGYIVHKTVAESAEGLDQLVTYYRNGDFLHRQSLTEIRERAKVLPHEY